MDLSGKRLEISIIILCLVVAGGLGSLFKAPRKTAIALQNLIYEMPRPKNSFFASLFNLGDREVSRRYDNPFAKKGDKDKKNTAVPAKSNAAGKPSKKVKDTVNPKEKSDKDPSVEVEVVGDDPNVNIGGDDIAWAKTGVARVRQNQTIKGTGTSADSNQDVGLSGAQWRALILAQPTKQNLRKLIDAYNKGEVEDSTLFTLVSDFFRDNKVDRQIIGLAIVKEVYSLKSFAVVSSHYNELAPEVQTKAQSYLLSYAVNSRLSILVSALSSNHGEIVTAAMQVVVLGYQKAKEGVSPIEDPRQYRGDGSTNTLESYSRFVPIFQKLTQSQDPQIASLASTALNQIQISVAALYN